MKRLANRQSFKFGFVACLALLPLLVHGQLIDYTNVSFDRWKAGDLFNASKVLTDVGFAKISNPEDDLSLRSANGKLVITICKTTQGTPILLLHTEAFTTWSEITQELNKYCEAGTINKHQETSEDGVLLFHCGNRTYLYRKVGDLYTITIGQKQ